MCKEDAIAMGLAGKLMRKQRLNVTKINLVNLEKTAIKYGLDYKINKNNSLSFTYNNIKHIIYAKSNRVHTIIDGINENTNLTLIKFIKINNIQEDTDIIKYDLFTFGKYKGKPIKMIYQKDKQYIDWLLKQDTITIELKQLLEKNCIL